MRRHLHWMILLAAVPVSYVLLMLVVQALSAAGAKATDPTAAVWMALAQLGALAAAVVVPVILLIRAIVQMTRTHRRAQRAKGHFTKRERSMLDRVRLASDAWERARAARTALLHHQVPATISQWDIVPYSGEVFFARTQQTYARYYGRDVMYSQSSTIALGNPAFVVGALAVTALANSSARSRAAAEAAPQWREWQVSAVYVSNRRLAVHAGGRWLSFDYATMTAVYPEVAAATLICQFADAEPLLLSGDDAAWAAVFTVLQTHGLDAVREHPSLLALDREAVLPDLPPVGRRR